MKSIRHLPVTLVLLLLWCCGSGSRAWAESLLVGATDFDGLPVAGVAFSVEWDEPANVPFELSTDELGQFQVDVPTSATVARVRLADNRFQSARGMQESRAGDRLLLFPVFGTDPEAMRPQERDAFAEAWGSIVTGQAPKDADSRTPPPVPARLGAFLEGYRREGGGEPFVHRADAPTSAATMVVRAVNTLGAPVRGAVVYLFGYDEASGTVRTSGSARTNGRGVATFTDAVADRHHRAEILGEDGTSGRTTILVSRAGETTPFPTVVLRPPGETISGLVYDGEVPAPGTMVQTIPSPGRSAISALTDASGHFALGPVRGGEGRNVVLVRRTADGPRMAIVEAPADGREMLVPFHLLSRAGEPGE